MINVQIDLNNFSVDITITGDKKFNGIGTSKLKKNTTLTFSGNFISENFDDIISFQYFLGPTCKIIFFNSVGNYVNELKLIESCDFFDFGSGTGIFQNN